MDNGNQNDGKSARKRSEICAHLRLAFCDRPSDEALPDRLAELLRAIAERHPPASDPSGDKNG